MSYQPRVVLSRVSLDDYEGIPAFEPTVEPVQLAEPDEGDVMVIDFVEKKKVNWQETLYCLACGERTKRINYERHWAKYCKKSITNVQGVTSKKPAIKRFIEFDKRKKHGVDTLLVKVEFESVKRKPFLPVLDYITDPRLLELANKLHKSKKLRKQREAVDKIQAIIQNIG